MLGQYFENKLALQSTYMRDIYSLYIEIESTKKDSRIIAHSVGGLPGCAGSSNATKKRG